MMMQFERKATNKVVKLSNCVLVFVLDKIYQNIKIQIVICTYFEAIVYCGSSNLVEELSGPCRGPVEST